jgi:hypothetical protein
VATFGGSQRDMDVDDVRMRGPADSDADFPGSLGGQLVYDDAG